MFRISITLSFFDMVTWYVNAFCHFSGKLIYALKKTIIRPALQTTLKRLLVIHHLQTGIMKMTFQISEQITVIRSQIWTVGRVVQ